MRKLFTSFVVVACLMLMATGVASAYISASSNYQLEKDSLNFSGIEDSASTNYSLIDTLGEVSSGLLSGSNYNASTGYRYMEAETGSTPTPTPVLGCTDPTANNYNSSATQDDGTCSYTHVSGGVFGCLDYRALNYNPNATVDDGSCVYAPIVTPVLGCTDSGANNYNPLATRNDGSCTYPPGDGGGGGGSGSGAFGCLDSRANNYNPLATRDDGSCEYSPFWSPTAEVVTTPSSEWDFRFIQPKEKIKTFDKNMRVKIVGTKDLTILFNYNLAPATLKTIGFTLTDPIDKTKTFSFLLHRNADGTAYEATISPLIRQGTYPADIYIINYDNQAITHIKGQLIVSGLGIFSMGTVALPAVATGLAVGFLPSLYDLLMILFRALGYFFGRKKKDNPWGTVYDSVTKRPLDPVYLTVSQILSAGQPAKEMATAITDIDGRFSFFLPAGTYTVKANKTHYRFPSERLAGKTNDELYDHLYFGGEFATTGEAIINLNIPMDPIDFDWNEFAKTKTNFFAFYQQRRLWLNRLYKFVFAVGLIFSVYSLVVSPLWWNAMILALYAILILINRFWRGRHKPLRVISAQTGEPLPFAIIRVFLPDLNQQIKYTVADKMGRFYLLVRPGVYYYTVEEKQPDGTYLKVFQSQPISLPKGVLTTDILAG